MNSDPIEDSPPQQLKKTVVDLTSSDDEFGGFDNELFQQTVATLPVQQRPVHPQAATHLHTATHATQPTQPVYSTQPTQAYTPKKLSQILVPASSSPARPSPQAPSLIRGIAPPGTSFRAPVRPRNPFTNAPQTQNTQSSDPPIIIESDSDGDELARADIPKSVITSFASNLNSRFRYDKSASNVPQKRSSDDMVSSYANSSRPPRPLPVSFPRQTGPARAIAKDEPMTIDDIIDWEVQVKVKSMSATLPQFSIDALLDALRLKKGNKDDAMNHLIAIDDEASSKNAVDLTMSDDEMPGVAQAKKGSALKRASNPRRPVEKISTIGERYSRFAPKGTQGTQAIVPPSPEPAMEPKKRKRLVQGRRGPTAEEATPDLTPKRSPHNSPERAVKRSRTEVNTDSEAEIEVVDEEGERAARAIEEKVLDVFNTCTEQELVDLVSCTASDASLIISRRPFRHLEKVRKVAHPETSTTGGKRRGGIKTTIGERVVDKAIEIETGLQAVDRVVAQCQVYTRDIKREMKSWGIDFSKTDENGLNLVSLNAERHDSGTGTPTSSEKGTKQHPRTATDFLSQPSLMSTDMTLKDYQIVGLNWLNLIFSKRKAWSEEKDKKEDAQIGCILADDMGLGKTCQVIAFLTHLVETHVRGLHLIVVPASTIENWLREFSKFSPQLHVEPYYGSLGDRAHMRDAIWDSFDDINVVVTTYETATTRAEDNKFLRNLKPTSCIFDEGHALKNSSSNRYKQLRRINTTFRLLLTGTPLQNNLQELMSVLAFIMPKLFQQCEDDFDLIFSHRAKTSDTDHAALLSARRIARAKSMLSPFILRRSKAQVMKDLPKKTKRVEYCGMTPRQEEFYTEYANMHTEALAARKAGTKTEGYQHLVYRRQAAIHPLLLPRYLYTDAIIEKMWPKIPREKGKYKKFVSDEGLREHLQWLSDFQLHLLCQEMPQLGKFALKNDEWLDSGKIDKVVELVKQFTAEGSRILIFSHFVTVLDILEAVFDTKGITRRRIDGSTPVNIRQTLIDQFYEDESINVFMLSTRSGGAGINLACANKVIIFDSGFNPQDDIQAENRAHRIGQTRDVEVVTLITKGTIEEQIYALGESKRLLDDRVTGGDDDAKGEDKAEKKGMEDLERLLLEKASQEEGKEGEVNEEEGAAGDLKDAFMNGLKARGVDVAED